MSTHLAHTSPASPQPPRDPLGIAILVAAIVCLLLAVCGCASLLARARAELDRLDLAALLDRYLEEIAPADPSAPADPAAPAAPTPSHPGDEIDLASVTWYGPDIRSWTVASDLPRGVYVSGSTLHFPHTRAGQWQTDKDGLEGNPWVIVRVEGAWRAASFEWLRKGQTDKPWAKVRADHIKVSAFSGYQLRRGEEFYVIVAGLSRGSSRGTMERTAARKVVWQ